jgi:hypothetical protein
VKSSITIYQLFICLVSWLILSCNDQPDTTTVTDTYVKHSITLTGLDSNFKQTDTLGTLFIQTPARLDTFYQWWNTSDCVPCGWIQYRLADSRYPNFAESGFFSLETPDSTYHITIRHRPKTWVDDGTTLRTIREKDSSLINDAIPNSLDRGYQLLGKEFIHINNHPFHVFYLTCAEGAITYQPTIYLIGITSLKDRYLQIIAEHSGNDTTGFYRMMYNSLMSVRIQEKL